MNSVVMQSSSMQPYASPQPLHPIPGSELDLQITRQPAFVGSVGTNATNTADSNTVSGSNTNSNNMNGNDEGDEDEVEEQEQEQGHSIYFRKDPSMDYQVDLHDDIINNHSIRQQQMGLGGIDNDNRYIPNPDYVGD